MQLRVYRDRAIENMLFCKQHYYETVEQMRLSDSYH